MYQSELVVGSWGLLRNRIKLHAVACLTLVYLTSVIDCSVLINFTVTATNYYLIFVCYLDY